MRIRDLAIDYMESRPTLLLDETAVIKWFIEAVREYQAWAKLKADGSHDTGAVVPVTVPADVTEDTDITPSEWGVIKVLANLFCEREVSLIQEASRVMSHEVYGRSSSEIEQEISNFRNEYFRLWAFSADIVSV